MPCLIVSRIIIPKSSDYDNYINSYKAIKKAIEIEYKHDIDATRQASKTQAGHLVQG